MEPTFSKLVLHRETVRRISPQDAVGIRGGIASAELPSVDHSVFIASCECVNTVWCSQVATFCVTNTA